MILIVDDNADLAETCAMMLESCGFEVKVALGGEAGMAEINTRCPDLLISDCCMPGMTGLQLCGLIRNSPCHFSFPILLMSGSLQCRVAPGDNYNSFIKKPFSAETLLTEVQKLLSANSAAAIAIAGASN
jgi:CheY-like chemotaxis protein